MRAPDFWETGGPLALLLTPAGWLYGLGGALRSALARPERAPVPVICVGNLTAGGTGKTPVVIAVAERLKAAGRHPHVVSRGYGGAVPGPVLVDPGRHGAVEVGDEPLLIARTCPTWVARDRVAGARAAAAEGADALVLDDGFQNPALDKDLAIVVVDGGAGFGNGRLIPAGPLREPVARGLGRADAAIVMGKDTAGVGGIIAALAPGLAVLGAHLQPVPEAASLHGRRVLGFAGIGRPDKLRETLEALGADVAAFHGFADHHAYAPAEIAALRAEAATLGARLVTTAKDAVRLSADQRQGIEVVEVTVAFAQQTALSALLAPFCPPSSAAPAEPGRGGSGTG